MRRFLILFLVVVLLVPLSVSAGDILKDGEIHLDWIAAIDPPHHEYIHGRFEEARAERFFLEIKPSIDVGRLKYYVAFQGHGVQKWKPSEEWGSRSQYWTNSEAWSVENWRYTIEHGGTFDIIGDKLQIYSRFVMPFERRSYHGVYYWRIGFSGRMF